jgi:hypothetical protein
MQLFVSKNNIRLHEGLFTSFEEAEAFAKKWLQKNVIDPRLEYTEGIATLTMQDIRWSVRKGRYYQQKKVVVRYKNVWHYPSCDSVYDHESAVIITTTNNERLW